MDALEKRTMDKVTWRLVPFLIACYFIAYLDRVNVGFANASMSKDLADRIHDGRWLASPLGAG
jgi:MFS transporter, ACS family, tartrate transporter